mgnify:FL=1
MPNLAEIYQAGSGGYSPSVQRYLLSSYDPEKAMIEPKWIHQPRISPTSEYTGDLGPNLPSASTRMRNVNEAVLEGGKRNLPNMPTGLQQAWFWGLMTPPGIAADISGKYPVPPGRKTTFKEMVAGEKIPSVAEHFKTGHPVRGGLQVLAGLPYLRPFLKAGQGIYRTARPASVMSDTPNISRRKFVAGTGAAAAIAGLGGLGRLISKGKASTGMQRGDDFATINAIRDFTQPRNIRPHRANPLRGGTVNQVNQPQVRRFGRTANINQQWDEATEAVIRNRNIQGAGGANRRQAVANLEARIDDAILDAQLARQSGQSPADFQRMTIAADNHMSRMGASLARHSQGQAMTPKWLTDYARGDKKLYEEMLKRYGMKPPVK